MYHAVEPDGDDPWSVSPDLLKAHAVELQRRGAAPVTVAGIPSVPDGDLFCMTFDDAYLSVYEHAFPVLSALGIAGTVFVPVDFIGGANTFDARAGLAPQNAGRRIMGWSHLLELQRAGWAIQSHGCSHGLPGMPGYPGLAGEFTISKATIEDRLGESVFALAYPYGIPPETHEAERLAQAGCDLGFLAGGGPAAWPPGHPLLMPRVIVLGGGGK